MLIQPITVSPWQANCYIVTASEEATDCLVVDPGITAAEQVRAVLADRGLTPVALLGTHGHVDHIGDAHLLAAEFGIPLHLAEADRHLITRPGEGLGPQGTDLMRRLTGSEELPAVEDVRGYDEGLSIAGLDVSAFEAPGHTKGSLLLTVASPQARVVFSGDVVFAGTIGRTDLPGGSMSEMRESLRRIVATFPPETPLLPGHGEPTSLERELAHNPYLQPENL